jgi:transposase
VIRRPASFASSGGGKTACGTCGHSQRGWYDRTIRQVRDLPCGDTRIYLALEIRRVECKMCGKVKQETLEWLADNPCYLQRFVFFVGRRCRAMPITDVAEETRLGGKTIKALEPEYMREQLRRAGKPAPKVIGLDEISIRMGHTSRIVGSDLEKRRPI